MKDALLPWIIKKHMILGNHDWGLFRAAAKEKFGLTSMKNSDVHIIGGQHIWLSHFPYLNSGDHTEGEERFSDLRFKDDGNWLLHGHVHNLWKRKGKMINVGVDVWNYRPVSLSDIAEVMDDC